MVSLLDYRFDYVFIEVQIFMPIFSSMESETYRKPYNYKCSAKQYFPLQSKRKLCVPINFVLQERKISSWISEQRYLAFQMSKQQLNVQRNKVNRATKNESGRNRLLNSK